MRLCALAMSVAVCAAPFAALAADAPVVGPLDAGLAPGGHDWTGAYLGVNAGYAAGDFEVLPPGTFSGDGANGGFQIGYNKQLGSMVIGVEGDLQAADIDGASGTVATSLDWFSTARGRVGYAFDSTLLYGTAGVAFAGVEASDSFGGSDDNTLLGLAAGAGVEQALTENISLKAEYLYVDLENKNFQMGATNTNAEWDGHVMRFGANLKF